MLALWSRAAQVQSCCRCRMCQHSTQTLTRRSTTTASRRRVTVADIFTACYTTILGTAAIIDGRQKIQRQQELDGELDRLRTSLKQFGVQGHQDPRDQKNGVSGSRAHAPRKIPTYIRSRRGKERVSPFLEELKSICNITYRPLAHQSWMQDNVRWAEIEAAVADEAQNPRVRIREPLSSDSLADTTMTIIDLVDELLRRVEEHPSRRVQDEAQISNHAKEDRLLEELESFRRGNEIPGYQFPSAEPIYSVRIRAQLNKAIRRIFNQAVPSRETVGRICYNLLTVGVPPTIHTYNILIAGFNRIERPDLAQAVIDSYLDRTTWPATDQTVVCMLNHYRGPGGKEGLREVVQRMRGAREDGLHLATLDGESSYRYHLSSKQQCQKGTRNDVTFDHLIRGWLYHEEVEIACMTFVACLRNGVLLPVNTLQELFTGCLATADYSNARKLLIGIHRNFEKFKSYLSWIMEGQTTAAVRGLLRSLHQIINICWLPFGEIFGPTFEVYKIVATSLLAIIGHVDAQLELQEMTPPSAQHTLKSPTYHLKFAISNLNKDKLSTRTLTKSERIYARIAMLVSVDRRFGDLEESLQSLVAAFNAAIISVKTGYHIDGGSILLSDTLGSQAFEDRRFAMRRALSQIDVLGNSLTIEDVASQLFRRIPNPALIGQLEENGNWKRLRIPILISFFGSNTASPRILRPRDEDDFSEAYNQVREQFYARKESIRALLFAHLSEYTQKRALYYHGYNNIGLRKLRTFLHKDLKYRLPYVLQTRKEFLNHPVPLEVDNPAWDTERSLKDLLPVLGEEGLGAVQG
ncbi:hypothetical protein F5X98DRAFT_331835 [Xylaria grammica]|nr:hypothetical protein F5X98DRAFT_331835 [Xylaria grammica]